MPHYRAMALQTRCRSIAKLNVAQARTSMFDVIARISDQIVASKRFVGTDTRLVVLPEYFLSSYPAGESIEEWRDKAALAMDGPEYAALGEAAKRADIYLAGNAYEVDPAFGDWYFQSSFIIDPRGEVILRYRRLVSMFAPTPHDVWTRYLEHYSLDQVFPVVDTELGRLAAVASEEILYPEISRMFGLRGAEVICHSTSEVGSPSLTPKDVAKRARAFENMCFVVSANSAGIYGAPLPHESTDGMSKIVGYQGDVLIEAGFGESMVANAELDIEALRRWRQRPGMSNVLSRQRTELFAASYADIKVHEANGLANRKPDRGYFVEAQKAALARLRVAGTI